MLLVLTTVCLCETREHKVESSSKVDILTLWKTGDENSESESEHSGWAVSIQESLTSEEGEQQHLPDLVDISDSEDEREDAEVTA